MYSAFWLFVRVIKLMIDCGESELEIFRRFHFMHNFAEEFEVNDMLILIIMKNLCFLNDELK